MSKGVNVQVSIKDVYDVVCPKCKEEIRKLVKESITDTMVTEVIGAK